MRYGMFAVGRSKTKMFKVEPQRELPEDALQSYWENEVDAGATARLQQERISYDADLRKFVDGTTSRDESVKVRTGIGKSETFVKRHVTFPDGHTEEFGADIQPQAAARQRFAKTHPKPADPPPPFAKWKSSLTVNDTRCWTGEWTGDGQTVTPPEFTKVFKWRYGIPMDEILAVLNRLASSGWVVVSVSEDRGVYAGVDTTNVSAPTAVRYLLENAEPAPG